MKTALPAFSMLLALTVSGLAEEKEMENTTIVRNGNSVSIITQSGDPEKAVVRIEKEPGRTTIYRRSGGNTSIVTQSSNLADFPLENLPPEIQDWLRSYKR